MPRYEYPEIAEKITYKKTPMYKGEMFSANLEKNRITIEVEGEMKVKAGKLVVLSDDEYTTLQAELEKAKELLKIIKDVERGLLFMQLPAEVREKLTTFLEAK